MQHGMNGWRTAGVVVAVIMCSLGGSPVHAQSNNDEAAARFVGAWAYVMSEELQSDGSWVQVEAPPDRVGLIVYTASGQMSVHLMRQNRREGGYTAYFGPYEIHADEGYVIHHRTGHLNPDQVGVDAKRFYAFSGDQLTLTVAPENARRLTWRRIE